jgi:hypothetical protein
VLASLACSLWELLWVDECCGVMTRDAGKSVKADNALINEAMEKAGERLNLASHLVASPRLSSLSPLPRLICFLCETGGRQDDHWPRRCMAPFASPLPCPRRVRSLCYLPQTHAH